MVAMVATTSSQLERDNVMKQLQGLSATLSPSDLQALLRSAFDLERQHGKPFASTKEQHIKQNGHMSHISPPPMLELAEINSVVPSTIEPVKTYAGQHEVAEILKDFKVVPELWDNLDLKVTDAKVAKGSGASLTVSGHFTGLKGYLDMTAQLDVSTSGATLTLSGNWKPIPDINLDKVSLGLKKGVVYTAEVEGTLADTLKADVKIIYPEDPKTNVIGLDFNASNVNIGAVVKHIWSSAPAFLLDFISPIAFSDVAIGYHADKYTILAHPDASHSPLLAKVLEVIHIDSKDIQLSDGTDGLKLAVSKTITLNLKNPFEGPAILVFALNLDQETKSFLFNASFQATLKLFGDPLAFEAEAGISVGEESGLEIAGRTLAPWHPKGFDFLTIDKFAIKAIISPEAVPSLLELHAQLDLLGAAAEVVVHYNAADASMAMLVDVEHVSLQRVLSELGVKADLGPFNLVLTKASESFADSDVTADGKTIPKGYYIEGICSLFGLLEIDVKLLLQTSGAEFELKLDATKMHPLVAQFSSLLNAELKAASGKIQDARDKADSKLKGAKDAVSAAETKLKIAQTAFDSAEAQVNKEIGKAKDDLQKAQAAFDSAKKHADDALAAAKAQKDNAQKAFDSAQASAMRGLINAKQTVSSAQRAFDDKKRSLDSAVNSAQGNVNGIQNRINHLKWWERVEQPALEAALYTAKGVLAAAKWAADHFLDGAEQAGLSAAQLALHAAEAIEANVAKGVEWTAIQSANGLLIAAQHGADAVLTGSLAVAVTAAKAALEVAQKAADNFLKGVIAAALAAAKAAFAAAQAELKLDQEAADGALSLAQDALKELNDISNAVLNEKLFVLDLFDFGFILTKAEVGVHLTGNMTVLGKSVVLPHIDLDMKNPLNVLKAAVTPLIMNEIKAVKTKLKHFL